MKLGPRLVVVTTIIVAGVLGASTWAMLRIRRDELKGDVDRQAREAAAVLMAGLDPIEMVRPPEAAADAPIDRDATRSALARRVAASTAPGDPFRVDIVAVGSQRAGNAWAGLVEEAAANDAPAGRLFEVEGRSAFYGMAFPLHSAPRGDPRRQIMAYLGLWRDCAFIDAEVATSLRRLLPVLAAATLAFAGIVSFILIGSVTRPLRRLVDAIDAVAKGDLSRAVLPDRDDEIGSLAGRFNAMMNYLRQAREDEAHAAEARASLETRLRQSEKLATVGQMAAEIAHEVGTPLNVIGGRARSLARRASEPAEIQKNAEIIGAQVDRIAKIIRQVLDFSRKSGPTLTSVDVERVIADTLEFVDGTLRRQGISTEVRAAPALPKLPGDPDEIQQVCLNLVSNAVHAMPGGGHLAVVVDTVVRRKEGLDMAPTAPYLMLEVGDTGPGIPAADREHIFEPFFTTKDSGEGTGLGLAVSKGIVKDHDGWIEVDDRPDGGAVFRVFLPLVHTGAAEAPALGTPGPTMAARSRVAR